MEVFVQYIHYDHFGLFNGEDKFTVRDMDRKIKEGQIASIFNMNMKI